MIKSSSSNLNVLIVASVIIQIISSLNIDVDNAIVYSSPSSSSSDNRNDYFGYSVLLYENHEKNISLLFVGAPRGNRTSKKYPDEPGIVYSCNNFNHTCTIIQPYNYDKEEGFISSIRMKITIEKEYAWFGAALAVEKTNGLLTICAPRTVIHIFNPLTLSDVETIHGMCYSGSISPTMKVYLEDENLSEYNFKSPFWYNPLRGFSIHYPLLQPTGGKKEINRVIGEPKHDIHGTLDLVRMNQKFSVNPPMSDELSQFGYSVSSGCYFEKNQLLYSGGAPGWRYKGMVAIIDHWKAIVVAKVEGQEIGGGFGASLTSGDINGDGLDDLIVGAPHSGQDNGMVYIFWGNSKKKFESSTNLSNNVKGAQFGYSLSCGDLNQDGFDDIIIGAPWEKSGVVYVYNGNFDFQYKNQYKPTQVIIPSTTVKSFGFSLSQPLDIDQNGYPDIAVGAYGSGNAFIFRARPVIEIHLNVTAFPEKILKETTSFFIDTHIGLNWSLIDRLKNISHKTDLEVTILVDQEHKRTMKTYSKFVIHGNEKNNTYSYRFIYLLGNVENVIDPMKVIVGYTLLSNNGSKEFCKTCPIEKENIKVETMIPFDNGCGEDDVCISNVSIVFARFIETPNNTWTIGSKDISLEIILHNSGEPAYGLSMNVIIPKGISLRNVLPSCLENMTKNGVSINCEIANPLGWEQQKSMIFNLDMKSFINESSHDETLYFSIIIKTHNKNEGSTKTIVPLYLITEISLALNGKSNEENYYILDDDRSPNNVTFLHIYQISNHGATSITEARIIINVPRILQNDSNIVLIHVYGISSHTLGNARKCDRLNFIQHNSNKLLSINATENNIYLDCSRYNIGCDTFICEFNEIYRQNSEIVFVQMIFDRSKIPDKFFENRSIIELTTDITVKIIRPSVKLELRSESKSLTTTFHCISVKNQRVSVWIIITSFCMGLVLFFVLLYALDKFGFFKRIVKERVTEFEEEKDDENAKEGGTSSYELLDLQ